MHRLDPSVGRAEELQRQADFFLAQGDSAQAENFYRRASDLVLTAYGPSQPRYAESLSKLALAYAATGRYPAAIKLHQRAMAIWRAAVGEDDPQYLASVRKLAGVHRAMGSFAEAERLYLQVLDIHGKSSHQDPAVLASVLTDLAWLYATQNRTREALAAISDAEHALDRMLTKIASRGTERDNMICLDSVRQGYDSFMSLVLRYFGESPDAAGLLLGIILRRKALGIEMSLARRAASMSDHKPSIQSRLKAHRLLRQRIARTSVQGLSESETPEMRHRDLQNRCAQRRELEAALARELAAISPLEKTLEAIDLHKVASALPADSALVEFVKFRKCDFASTQLPAQNRSREYHYAALILLDGMPTAVRVIALGEARIIDRLVAQFRSCIMRGSSAQERGLVSEEEQPEGVMESPGIALRAAVFDPLGGILGHRSRLLLAPDGELTRLPFEALPLDGASRYLVDDYRLSYLDTGRELLRAGMASQQLSSAPVVVADPDFELAGNGAGHKKRSLLGSLFRKWRSRDVPGPSLCAAVGRVPNRHSQDARQPNWHFERLPGTRIEGELVAAALRVPLWQGSAALERPLKERVSPRILHLATHGFIVKDHRRYTETANENGEAESRFLSPENPLLNYGLALAGANRRFTPESLPEDAEDGVLTAEDIAGLDLRGTELVVLSACETGLGEVAVGEGVMGLRRAFILAGAKSLIMSLWKVADLPTAVFMSRFYEYLIDKHVSRAEALQRARYDMRRLTAGDLRKGWLNTEAVKRLSVSDSRFRGAIERYLAQPDSYHPFAHPYYWGAFVLLGATDSL
ncbi:MAG: CHAT domain-containing protein [Gammaproteobacteria bacterium]